MRKIPFENDLYVISDSVDVLKRAVDDGAGIVQLRDKYGSERTIREKAEEVIAYKKVRPFIFILNDDPVLAVKVKADGVHVGQDTSTVETRKIIGEEMILGKTTHNLEQARQAVAEGADYISVGPVYETPTKLGRPATGLSYVREASEHIHIPWVAIGGINLKNIDEVLAAGAKTIGIVRASKEAPYLLKKIKEVKG